MGNKFKIRTTYNNVDLGYEYDPSCKDVKNCDVEKFLNYMNGILIRDENLLYSKCYTEIGTNEEIYNTTNSWTYNNPNNIEEITRYNGIPEQ